MCVDYLLFFFVAVCMGVFSCLGGFEQKREREREGEEGGEGDFKKKC